MKSLRWALGAALALNTSIFVAEAVFGWHASSMSLLQDAVHNLSDELALMCLFAASFLPGFLGRQSQRAANLFNSLGLIGLSIWMAWQSILRWIEPVPVAGPVALVVGLGAALGNAGVAAVLRRHARASAAVRLAWLHNRADALVSLAPAAAGLGVWATGLARIDSAFGLAVAALVVGGTLLELRASGGQLLWPESLEMAAVEAGSDPPWPRGGQGGR